MISRCGECGAGIKFSLVWQEKPTFREIYAVITLLETERRLLGCSDSCNCPPQMLLQRKVNAMTKEALRK